MWTKKMVTTNIDMIKLFGYKNQPNISKIMPDKSTMNDN